MGGNQKELVIDSNEDDDDDKASQEEIEEFCSSLANLLVNTVEDTLGTDCAATVIISNREFTFFRTTNNDLGALVDFLNQFKAQGTIH